MDATARAARSARPITLAALALAAGLLAGSATAETTLSQSERAARSQVVVHAALTPNDTFFSNLSWPATSINLPSAWDATLGDPSITIAIVDTGVNAVPDLAGALVPGYDFVHGNASSADDNGHGTEVASVAAARTSNGVGIAGVCGRCSIMPVKVMDASGSGSSSTVAQGIAWAAAHGAKVINLSATTPADDPVLDAAIASATAGGAVVVLAAGNNGSTDPASGGYPAASSPEAIRVAGVDENGGLFSWSNHGSWVDVAAPGSGEAATAGGQYFLGVQGTSIAAPFVSGIAGLLLSRNSGLAPAAVKSLIVSNGQQIAGLDVSSGRRVDAYASLVADGYAPPAPVATSASELAVSPSPGSGPATPAQPAAAVPRPAATRLPAVSAKTTKAAKKRSGCTTVGRAGTMVGSGKTSSRVGPSCRGL